MRRNFFHLLLVMFLFQNLFENSREASSSKVICAEELQEPGVCYLTREEDDFYIMYVKACKSGKVCQSYQDGFSKCVEKAEKREEGEKCVVGEECKTGICGKKNGKTIGNCAGIEAGGECESHNQCKYGYYCSTDNKCTSYSKEGESCTKRYECDIGLACSDSKCVKVLSKNVGETSYLDIECKTLKLDVETNKCTEWTVSDSTCDASDQCSYKVSDGTKETTQKVDCIEAYDGVTMRCKVFGGKLLNELVKLYGERIEKIKKDKTIHSRDFDSNSNDLLFYKDRKLVKAYNSYYYSNYIEGADKCVKEYMYYLGFSSSRYMIMNFSLMIGAIIALF